MRRVSTTLLVWAVIAVGGQAHAQLSQTCPRLDVSYSDPSIPWFAPKTIIPVYVSTASSCNFGGKIQDLDITHATGLTLAEVELGVIKAVQTWNEESGSSIKLRYMQSTTVCPTPQNPGVFPGAVLIIGIIDGPKNDNTCPFGLGFSSPTLSPTTHQYVGGNIEIRKFERTYNCQTPVVWSINAQAAARDLVSVLIHELGHQVYNMAHPDGGSPECPNYHSVMRAYDDTGRHLWSYDREVAQLRYGPRSNWSSIWKSKHISGSTWTTAQRAYGDGPPQPKRPLFRMGSLTTRLTERLLAWGYGTLSPTVQPGGAAQRASAQYFAGMSYWNLYNPPGGVSGPIAVASRWQYFSYAPEVLMAYWKVDPSLVYSEFARTLCYAISTDQVNFPTEICPVFPTYSATTYGLTATFDLASLAFIVAFTGDGAPPNPGFITIQTIPSSGSLTPASQAFVYVGGVALRSVHAPSVACRGTFPPTSTCILVYERPDNGQLGWVHFHIDANGAPVVDSSAMTQSIYVFDTPSVAYDCDQQVYRLLNTTLGSRISSYKMDALSGTTWTSTGTVFDSVSNHVSTATLGTRPHNSQGCAPYAWFVKYW